MWRLSIRSTFFFFQAADGIRDTSVTGVQTCALPILGPQPPQIRSDPEKVGQVAVHFINEAVVVPGLPRPEPLPTRPANERSEERRVGKEGRWKSSRETRKRRGQPEDTNQTAKPTDRR